MMGRHTGLGDGDFRTIAQLLGPNGRGNSAQGLWQRQCERLNQRLGASSALTVKRLRGAFQRWRERERLARRGALGCQRRIDVRYAVLSAKRHGTRLLFKPNTIH